MRYSTPLYLKGEVPECKSRLGRGGKSETDSQRNTCHLIKCNLYRHHYILMRSSLCSCSTTLGNSMTSYTFSSNPPHIVSFLSISPQYSAETYMLPFICSLYMGPSSAVSRWTLLDSGKTPLHPRCSHWNSASTACRSLKDDRSAHPTLSNSL